MPSGTMVEQDSGGRKIDENRINKLQPLESKRERSLIQKESDPMDLAELHRFRLHKEMFLCILNNLNVSRGLLISITLYGPLLHGW